MRRASSDRTGSGLARDSAGLDDAARGHFEAAGGLQRRVAEGSEFLDEPPVGWLPAEFRPRGFDVAAQRPAVLQFLGEPVMLEP